LQQTKWETVQLAKCAQWPFPSYSFQQFTVFCVG